MHPDSFGSRSTLASGSRRAGIYRLRALESAGIGDVATLPYSLKVLLENLLRHEDGKAVRREDVVAVASWDPRAAPSAEIAFTPARILLQDFTGVPAVVDMAAMREAFARMGGDAARINPLLPGDLVIDHSVQVDAFGSAQAFRINADLEMQRNRERYALLRWGQKALRGFRVVPPDTGIVHQVNVEYLAQVVFVHEDESGVTAYPDTLVGTDSHTTMVNGLGVVGWGVGGIEAEAAMLGQPVAMLLPQVIGFELTGRLSEGATATDLVLTVTQMLRKHGVVGKFVEFFGSGLDALTLPDRATIANMAPEYGATIGLFPIDAETLTYLRFSGRPEEHVRLVEAYAKEQGLFREAGSPPPRFTDTLKLDLGAVEPSLAGPKRPQDRVPLKSMKATWRRSLSEMVLGDVAEADPRRPTIDRWSNEGGGPQPIQLAEEEKGHLGKLLHRLLVHGHSFKDEIGHGAVTIAAITSCTNTSNPAVMMAAGLVARKAVARGLTSRPWVKTSLAPGSQVVTEYLQQAGVLADLEKLGFHVVGYGCTTCIGNSGPLPDAVAKAVNDGDLVVASVLSGNRNFEGRVNPLVKANYLASPPLVVVYALAGTVDIDLTTQPLGEGHDGPVYLKDVWPTQAELAEALAMNVRSEHFTKVYANVLEGTAEWRALPVPEGDTFAWDPASTYVRNPPFFDAVAAGRMPVIDDIRHARVLAKLGDSITTDHISPAGSIKAASPAGKYLQEHGVAPEDFNSYGARRGNHEVMVRGTFANIRLRNELAPGTEGGMTTYLPTDEVMSIFDASMKYQAEGVPLIVLAGKEYGSGSSRDWAAKGPYLLGIKAVLAESFERIHRSNLVGMGILPMQFEAGATRHSLGLTGREAFAIEGLALGVKPGQKLTVRALGPDGEKAFTAISRIDTLVEVDYFLHGGILPFVLKQLAARA
jgi:aconitate hydratase